MSLRNFFVGRGIVFAILILLGLAFFIYQLSVPEVIAPIADSDEQVEPQEEFIGPADFTWRFSEADSLNPDGNPNTDIFLDAVYANGVTHTQYIDTTAGSCNEVEYSDTDIVPVSSTIICYSAGLGYYFSVSEEDDAYLVQRKMIEEASPEYTPPEYAFEVIAKFPLSKSTENISDMNLTERYSARVDRVDVVFEHTDYTRYRLMTNGAVREGELNTERGFGDDPDATVYVLNWQRPEGEQIRYVRFTNEPDRIYVLDGNGEPIQGSVLFLDQQNS